MEEDFRLRHEADIKFPLEVNDLIIRKAISQFQAYTDIAKKHLDHICCCCNCFLDPGQLKHIFDTHPIVMTVFNTDILHRY